MKIKKITNLVMALMMTSLLVFTLLGAGCAAMKNGKPSLLGTVKDVIVGNDYEAAGKTVGEAAYMGFLILEGNPKYDKYTEKCKELYKALDNAESETVKLGTVNSIAMEVMQVALTAKYGYVKAQLITTGVRIGGAVADRIIANKVDTVAADKFIKGFKEGIDLAIAKTPADALTELEKPKAFECKDGNCTVTVGSRDVQYQRKVAKQLIDDGYADKNEKPKEGAHTAYQNLKDLQERCKVLRKFGVAETNCYIHHFTVKDGKLAEIEFRMISYDGEEFVTDCVTCCTMPELESVEE